MRNNDENGPTKGAHPTSASAMFDELLKRLSLWLAIGNAGGLIALAAKFSDLQPNLSATVLPSLWAFAVGIVASYAASLSLLAEYDNKDDCIKNNLPYTADKNWNRIGGFSTLLSVFCFLFGVFYPLSVISLTQYSFSWV